MPIDTEGFQPIEALKGDSEEDTELLQAMAGNARDYVASFNWHQPIRRQLLAFGVGGVVAVFLVEFEHPIAGTDRSLWIVVGDLPSVYMVTDALPGPKFALEAYCDLMQAWVDAVESGSRLDDVFPVRAEPNLENAKLLRKRIQFLRREILPVIQ